ncbi:bifunctional nicotinamidase/pyrazinamidase [Consotaella aegiceratis]|uniref:bifunctional nicotinamidase/pyrazinamidase n=1 Tax=Consotaella aegiceratis TaxID=3097961 RepID=UPI002F40C85A
MPITPSHDDLLLVVDVQNDFCPGGALIVPDGDAVVPVINALAQRFSNVVLTQDWHPADHVSFASQHGKSPFETVALDYGEQVLWPDHCVQGTPGAEFHPDLDIPHAQLVIRKGYHRAVDSYSAFQEADHVTPTGLAGYMRERNLRRIFAVGLATDFCVAWSALDGRRAGFKVSVIDDGCRAIDLNGSLDQAWDAMASAGVGRMAAAELLG